jgi:hydrogenase/urease accessory protein HupE
LLGRILARCADGVIQPAEAVRVLLSTAAAVCVLLAAGGRVEAHPLAPALLELQEHDTGRVDVLWKTPLLRVPGTNVHPVLPERCRPLGEAVPTLGSDSVTMQWQIDCGERGIVGERVGFAGLDEARTDALIRITLRDGRTIQGVVRAAQPMLAIPVRERSLDLVRSYFRLGVERILTRLDHLLFVVGLLLLVAGGRDTVRTVAAFAIGHSITLSVAVLGLVALPAARIDFLIALSVFALAVELSRPADARPTLMRRYPWCLAGLFGLLHGLGFAAALTSAGLPQLDVPLALLSFNLGIEAGQVVFVALALLAVAAWRSLARPIPRWAEQLPLYAIGSLSAFWCFERVSAFFQ